MVEKKKYLGELLKEKSLVTEEQIKYCLQEQKITKEKIGETIERLGLVTEYDVVIALAEQAGVLYIDMDEVLPEEYLLKLFNKNLCITNIFIPIKKKENYEINDM